MDKIKEILQSSAENLEVNYLRVAQFVMTADPIQDVDKLKEILDLMKDLAYEMRRFNGTLFSYETTQS